MGGHSMLDRTIPFYNLILRCDQYPLRQIQLPVGYTIASYKKGYETDWAKLECAVGDFANCKEAVRYFTEKYLIENAHEKILFLLDNTGQAVGSCISWTDERYGEQVNSLHWLIVDEAHQGKGLGRALCTEVMNRFYLCNQKPIYIHTQPWSWKAILLYISLGFRVQKTDTFSAYTNQYNKAMQALKAVLSHEQYLKFLLASDE